MPSYRTELLRYGFVEMNFVSSCCNFRCCTSIRTIGRYKLFRFTTTSHRTEKLPERDVHLSCQSNGCVRNSTDVEMQREILHRQRVLKQATAIVVRNSILRIYYLRHGGYVSAFVCMSVSRIIQKAVDEFRSTFWRAGCVASNRRLAYGGFRS